MEDIKKMFSTPKSKLVGIVVIVLVLILVVNTSKKQKEFPEEVGKNLNQKSVVATPPPVDPAILAADKAQLAELKKKFSYSYDEFKKVGWYENKSQGVNVIYDKDILRVYVNNEGYAYLADQYTSDDWIFHTRVEVKIGDVIYKTEDIPNYDPDNSTDNGSGSVWETISYTNGRDNGIIKAIAESGDTPIKVRFTGGKYYHDITLAKRDQQAIKDAYQLSELIKKVGDTNTAQ